jgi:hypothetical protein
MPLRISDNFSLSDSQLSALQNFYGVSRYARWQMQDWCYYDTVFVPSAGTAELQFFAVQAGGADPNRPAVTITKTNEQTNLPSSGQIGGAECFVPMSIHHDLFLAPKIRQQVAAVTTQTTYGADQLIAGRWLQNMSNKGVWVWTINNDTFAQLNMPWRRMPPGFGLGEVTPASIAGVTAPINGGANVYAACSPYSIFGMGDIYTLDQPMFLAPNTPFTWKIQFPEGNSIVTTGQFNGAGTTHTEIGTWFAYAEMRGVKIRPEQ